MQPYSRIERVNNLIHKELSKIIFDNFSIENVIITVLSVDTSPDLIHTKISIAIYPQEKAEESFRKLVKYTPEFQRLLNQKLRMRPVPKIDLILDRGGEKMLAIENTLRSLQKPKRRKAKS